MKFHLTAAAIDPAALLGALDDAGSGACVTFEGRVRNLNGGRAVRALDYEAYGPLAEKEGEKILAEARKKFPIHGAACVHRTGRLRLGEIAVWVAVTSAHRGAAFEACRYIIDETKARVPIWKKEHYAKGASAWIDPAGKSGDSGAKPRARRGSASAGHKRG
jgi:molybdopterin synthase catalytic subunit